MWFYDRYYLLVDVHRLCRKKEIDPVVITPMNSPINAAPANNPFDGHSVKYIVDVRDILFWHFLSRVLNDIWLFNLYINIFWYINVTLVAFNVFFYGKLIMLCNLIGLIYIKELLINMYGLPCQKWIIIVFVFIPLLRHVIYPHDWNAETKWYRKKLPSLLSCSS